MSFTKLDKNVFLKIYIHSIHDICDVKCTHMRKSSIINRGRRKRKWTVEGCVYARRKKVVDYSRFRGKRILSNYPVVPFDFTSHRSPRRKLEGSVNRKSYRGRSGSSHSGYIPVSAYTRNACGSLNPGSSMASWNFPIMILIPTRPQLETTERFTWEPVLVQTLLHTAEHH